METRFELPVDGAALAVREWRPEGRPRATLQIVHGMSEHAGRYAGVAEAFTRAGFAVLAHDLRGHGHTRTEHGPGHLGSWRQVLQDVRAVAAEGRRRVTDAPAFLLAHSMGSFLAQELQLTDPGLARGWILSGSDGPPSLLARAGIWIARLERLRLGAERPSPLIERLSFGRFNDGFEGRTPFDWLSRDPREVDAYVADPLCGRPLSTGSWVELLRALVRIARSRERSTAPSDLPTYVLGGDQDPVSRKGRGLRALVTAYRSAGCTDVTLDLVAGARHEVLADVGHAEVHGRLVAWCDAIVTRGSTN